MKLVEGQTLATLFEDRRNPEENRRRFLAIFEKVCETVAYAHAEGVIHRDLKPSNIMVGAFGEVQVMDWGLAKVLRGPGTGPENAEARRAPDSSVSTVRTRSASSHSETGSIMGTPAYMAPEQARGEVEQLDERADVFALGALLTELLTGAPPYVGESAREVRIQAGNAELEDAHRRLDACTADRELVNLARRCLSASRSKRPRHAAEVLEVLASYLASVEERLRAAELAEAEARAKAVEERRARRLTVALAAAIVLVLATAGAGTLWVKLDRIARMEKSTEAVNHAVDNAALLRGQAKAAPVGDLAPWALALEAARGAVTLAESDPVDPATRQRTLALRRAVEAEAAEAHRTARQAEADRRMVNRIEEINTEFVEHHRSTRFRADIEEAFREFGIDVVSLEPEEAGARIRGRAIREELVAALEAWACPPAGWPEQGRAQRERLIQVANAADPDPWRRDLRAAFLDADLTRLEAMAASERTTSLPPRALDVLATTIGHMGAVDAAVELYRFAQRRYPGDYSINLGLAHFMLAHVAPPRLDQAIRFITVAAAVRPKSPYVWYSLGTTQVQQGDYAGACGAFTEAIRFKPDWSAAYADLAIARMENGDLEGSLEASRHAIRLEPDLAMAHYNLGVALEKNKDTEGAMKAYREAIRLDPDHAPSHNNLGAHLRHDGRIEEAIEEFETALSLDPDLVHAHHNLALALAMSDDLDRAIEVFEKAVRYEPVGADVWFAFATTLARSGRYEEAIARFERARDAAEGDARTRAEIEERIKTCRRRLTERDR
jgi:serine/threonine-protein kinase